MDPSQSCPIESIEASFRRVRVVLRTLIFIIFYFLLLGVLYIHFGLTT